ncbi:hypothetical protein ACHWQZ_G006554 [Mnemiopsis leidyi]
MLDFEDLPYELQCEVFKYVDLKDFSNACCVCNSWNKAMNDSNTWIGRLMKKNIHVEPGILHYILFDRKEMMNFYILQSKSNLLKNVNFDDGKGDLSGGENFPPNFDHWHYHHGNWRIERHVGCDPFPSEAICAKYNAVTTYFSCERKQKIDLSKWYPNIGVLLTNGYHVRLYWKVWIAARYDCHSIYQAFILFENRNAELEDISNDDTEENNNKIRLAKHNIPAGKKWIKLCSTLDLDPSKGTSFTYYEAGQDSKFWAGHYGSKILNPTITVRIVPN